MPNLSVLMRHKLLLLFIILLTISYGCNNQKTKSGASDETQAKKEKIWLSILGGATGGTFSPFAAGVGNVVSKAESHIKISVEASAGSIENVRRVNGSPEYLGVAFASDAYLGYNGQEVFAEEGEKENIRVVTLLYIAYNQFSTLANSDVRQFEDIAGKKIAMGAAGSGSAQTLERLASLAGIQGKYTPIYKGGMAGGNALRDGQVAGFQWLVSAPNAAILEVSTIKSIRLIDFDAPARKYGFYEKYPFYLSGTLPGGVYKGIDQPVNTLLMPTVLIAHKDTDEETINTILKHVYSKNGHETLVHTHHAAKDMTVENAPKAFVIPLHRRAYRFWNEQGVEVPEAAQPVD
ncbi:MAG: TAXI family TRAP transporter solute-binding subunit [Candidatus Poribacteria bacterium]|nr:TAXI family TRAP transporter solute-binding subunit [Candidatus Poribacteria bacterium]